MDPIQAIIEQLISQSGPRGATYAGRVIQPGTNPSLKDLMTQIPTEAPEGEGMGGVGLAATAAGGTAAKKALRLPGVIGYEIFDTRTGQVIGKYGGDMTQWRRARTRVDKLDQAYGGVRYTLRPIQGE